MLNTKLSVACANASVDAQTALLNGGEMRLYTAPQPADADTAITTQTLLATFTFGTPAFAAAMSRVALANTMGSDLDAPATGDAAWFRLRTSGGASVMDGSVGTVDANFIMNDPHVVQHARVDADAFAITAPLG